MLRFRSTSVTPRPARRVTAHAVRRGMVVTRAFGIGFIVLVVLCIAAAHTLFDRLIPNPGQRTVWSSITADPVPADFLYVMFPARPDVPVRDAPDGAEVGRLTRALANRHVELGADNIAFPADGRTLYVRRADLDFGPPTPESLAQWLPGLEAAIAAAAPGWSPTVAFVPGESGTTAKLKIASRSDWDEFEYQLAPDQNGRVVAAAQNWRRFSGDGRALGGSVRLVGSVVLGITVAMTLGLVVMMIAYFSGKLRPITTGSDAR